MTEVDLSYVKTRLNERIEEILEGFGFDIRSDHREIRCQCPIHGGDNPTSFHYVKSSGTWRCYSHQCDQEFGHDIYGIISWFLFQHGKPSDMKACFEWACGFLGLKDMPETTEIDRQIFELKKIKEEIEEKSLNIPVHVYDKHRKKDSRFLSLGFTKETLEKFKIGYCHLYGKPMYGRSYAPVLSSDGKIVLGLTGRIWIPPCPKCGLLHTNKTPCPQDGGRMFYPKWKHLGFSKSEQVYNIDACKSDTIIVVEGPKDVWWLDQNGLENSAAIFGLYVSQAQTEKLISQGVKNIGIMLNTDDAGQKATKRIVENLSSIFNITDLSPMLGSHKDAAEVKGQEIKALIKNIKDAL